MSPARTGLVIGPSTGWLYAKGISFLPQQETFLKDAGANAVEVCLARWDPDDERMASLEAGAVFDGQTFVHQSLHLPDVTDRDIRKQIKMAQLAVARCGATVALTHPLKTVAGNYPISSYKRMLSGGVPLAVENIDSRKTSGVNLIELEGLVVTIGCGFVLDVQHAYEHDKEMGYALALLKVFEGRLTHLHVSGETADNIHSLVFRARNARSIVDFVGRVLAVRNVPLILEGEFINHAELCEEIEFLKRELSPG